MNAELIRFHQHQAAKHADLARRYLDTIIRARKEGVPNKNGIIRGRFGDARSSSGWYYGPQRLRAFKRATIAAQSHYATARQLLGL